MHPSKSILLATLSALSLVSVSGVVDVEVATGTPKPIRVNWQKTIVEGEGLWPTPLIHGPDQSLLTFGYTHPKHGRSRGGEVDAWISKDSGQSWTRGGSLAPVPDEVSTRMNHGVGVVDQGKRLIAVVSGYREVDRPGPEKDRWDLIFPVISESTDGGKVWKEIGVLDVGLEPSEAVIPFGTIYQAADQSLRLSVYHRDLDAAYMLESSDGGKSWSIRSKIGDDLSETGCLPLSDKEWLAISRTTPEEGRTSGELRQMRSLDDGKTWIDEGNVTQRYEHPADIKRLKDGRLLLTYSIRTYGAIVFRISDNDGASWGRPYEVSAYKGDGGYPSSVELADGSILTTFYAKRSKALGEGLDQYHIGLVNWALP